MKLAETRGDEGAAFAYLRIGGEGTATLPRLGSGRYVLTGQTEGKSWEVPFTLPGAEIVRVP